MEEHWYVNPEVSGSSPGPVKFSLPIFLKALISNRNRDWMTSQGWIAQMEEHWYVNPEVPDQSSFLCQFCKYFPNFGDKVEGTL